MLKTFFGEIKARRDARTEHIVAYLLKMVAQPPFVVSRKDAAVVAAIAAVVMIAYMAVRFFYLRDLLEWPPAWQSIGLLSFWATWILAVLMNVVISEQNSSAIQKLFISVGPSGERRLKKWFLALSLGMTISVDLISDGYLVSDFINSPRVFFYAPLIALFVIAPGYFALRRMTLRWEMIFYIIFPAMLGAGMMADNILRESFMWEEVFLGVLLVLITACHGFQVYKTKWGERIWHPIEKRWINVEKAAVADDGVTLNKMLYSTKLNEQILQATGVFTGLSMEAMTFCFFRGFDVFRECYGSYSTCVTGVLPLSLLTTAIGFVTCLVLCNSQLYKPKWGVGLIWWYALASCSLRVFVPLEGTIFLTMMPMWFLFWVWVLFLILCGQALQQCFGGVAQTIFKQSNFRNGNVIILSLLICFGVLHFGKGVYWTSPLIAGYIVLTAGGMVCLFLYEESWHNRVLIATAAAMLYWVVLSTLIRGSSEYFIMAIFVVVFYLTVFAGFMARFVHGKITHRKTGENSC